MSGIIIEVDQETAKEYEQSSPSKKEAIADLVRFQLLPSAAEKVDSLLALIGSIQEKAVRRGSSDEFISDVLSGNV